jgi:hypothetical protein
LSLLYRHDDRIAGRYDNSIDVPVMVVTMMMAMRHNDHRPIFFGESRCGGGGGDDYGRKK